MSGDILVVLGLTMDEDTEAMILERLAVFDDERISTTGQKYFLVH